MLKWTIALVIAASAYTANAQAVGAETVKAAETKAAYQLTFVVKEMDGDRIVHSRTYSTGAITHGQSAIRAGEKVPYVSSGEGSSTVWQQIDVGVAIDCRELELIGDRLSVRVAATVDSIAPGEDKNSRQPIIRNNRWDASVIVPLKQPTVIFSSDDPFSTQKVQLQVTVTPLH